MEIESRIKDEFPDVTTATTPQGEFQVKVPAEELFRFCKFTLEQLGFENLSCLTAVDRKDRLELVIHLYTMKSRGPKLVVKVDLPRENPEVASVTPIWPAADWHEREAFDMFGIVFTGHPDLRRILLPENWQGGFPLRKDFVDQRPERHRLTRVR